jgi:hypothetical protein
MITICGKPIAIVAFQQVFCRLALAQEIKLTRTILFRTFAKGAGVSYNGVNMTEQATAGF